MPLAIARLDHLRSLARALRPFGLVAVTSALFQPRPAGAQQADLTRRAFPAAAVGGVDASFAVRRIAPSGSQAPQRERSRTGRVVLQFLASSAGAAGAGLAAYLVFQDVGTTRVKGDAGYTRAGNVAYLTGSFAGATLGAHVVGRRMGGRSPLWATAVGAAVGTLPLLAAGGVDEPYLPLIGIALGWIPQAAFATIGFDAGDRGSR